MPRQIRKRGCSSSSSSSSILQNYRFKRAILVGKPRGSRSSTPVPAWRMMSSRAPESPKYPPSLGGGGPGKSRPVSARKLAATLWEMNEIPSPRVREDLDEKKSLRREMRIKERMGMGRSVHSGSLPPHLSDPSHSPVSERMGRSITNGRQRRTPSISQRLGPSDNNVGVDSLSTASFMEIETRSRSQTPSGSIVGFRARLKGVSNALITSKELLKIINRMWAHDDQPSSSMSLISALHAELERARLQVNQLIQEQCSDENEINYLMKCFAEEKAAWRKKEQQVIEGAIESVVSELEVEQKLRRRSASLNKELRKELAETKALLMKAVKELDSEKRAREKLENACDMVARDLNEDKAGVQGVKGDPVYINEELEKESEMLQLSGMLHDEAVQVKLPKAKHQFGKNPVTNKLRNQLEAMLRPKREKEKRQGSPNWGNNEEIVAYSRARFGSHLNKDKEEDEGEAEDEVGCKEDSVESDLQSIDLNVENSKKSYNWTHASGASYVSKKVPIDAEINGRNSTSGKASRRSTSLQRTMSDGVEWGIETENVKNSGDGLDQERFYELEKQAQRKVHRDDKQRHKSAVDLRDQALYNSLIGSARDFASPTRQWGQPWLSRDPGNAFHARPAEQGNGLRSRQMEIREGHHARRLNR